MQIDAFVFMNIGIFFSHFAIRFFPIKEKKFKSGFSSRKKIRIKKFSSFFEEPQSIETFLEFYYLFFHAHSSLRKASIERRLTTSNSASTRENK